MFDPKIRSTVVQCVWLLLGYNDAVSLQKTNFHVNCQLTPLQVQVLVFNYYCDVMKRTRSTVQVIANRHARSDKVSLYI